MRSFIVRLSLAKKFFLIIVIALLGWGAYVLWFKPNVTVYQLATAARGAIVESVSVTGNTAPVQSIDLALENGGTITAVNAYVGAHVNGGDVMVRLDTSDLQAQLAQSQANVDTQIAKLRSLQAGAQPADIQASQASLAKGQQDLTNLYASISDVTADSFAKADDAVRGQLVTFFSAPESNSPTLTFSVSDSQTLNDIQSGRMQMGGELDVWQKEISGISAVSPSSTLETALQNAASHLNKIKQFFALAAETLVEATNLSSATVNTYKAQVSAGLNEVNTANKNVNSLVQNIASQKITVTLLKAQLDLKVAGATQEDIQAQQAQVEQAQAQAQSIQVKIAKASLVAPVAGIITVQNAKVGQIAAPGAVLISIISDGGLEVDANIPEADIGKVSVGDPTVMTLDAFPGQNFSGKVIYIDPGETVIEGVPTYKTKFAFGDLGPEVKPGMTANLDITASAHDNVIYIPQRAVATGAAGSRTVRVYHGANQPIETRAVTVGLRDVNGNIEIISGLNEGDIVVNSAQ